MFNRTTGSKPVSSRPVAVAALRRLARDDSAQGLVEYAFIIALIALVMIAGLKTLAQRSSVSLSTAGNQLS